MQKFPPPEFYCIQAAPRPGLTGKRTGVPCYTCHLRCLPGVCDVMLVDGAEEFDIREALNVSPASRLQRAISRSEMSALSPSWILPLGLA